ncbi:MAG: lexA [Candidatus Parcubacteria bacterium]|nr:lexA [Candidatus Parcubacteria bacterium]
MDSYKDKIFGFYQDRKRMPSYAEIMKLVGFKSKNAVYKLIQKLMDEGAVTKDSTGRLIPNRMLGEIPLLGLVEAGFPAVAEEVSLSSVSLEDFLIEKKEKTYLLEVKGESMIDAGIQEGDYVLAERGKEAKAGDIVIAEVDGGWTMKYLRYGKDRKPYLEPANKAFKNIYPTESFVIAAVVKGVVRKY